MVVHVRPDPPAMLFGDYHTGTGTGAGAGAGVGPGAGPGPVPVLGPGPMRIHVKPRISRTHEFIESDLAHRPSFHDRLSVHLTKASYATRFHAYSHGHMLGVGAEHGAERHRRTRKPRRRDLGCT